MKPFDYNWSTKHRKLQVGDIVIVKDCITFNSVAIVRPGLENDAKMSRFLKPLKISHDFRVKRLIGPFQHTLGYYADNINNIRNKTTN